jgi:putative peptidoglycan lipid II flippase
MRRVGPLRAAAQVGSVTTLSRVLGLVRDVAVASTFGAGAAADAFFVAFRIPNFLRRLLAEGAFSQAFVPVLGEYRTTADHAAVRRLIAHVYGVLGATVLVLSALAVLAAPWLVHLFAPGFGDDPQRHALAAELLRITFPYLACVSVAAVTAGVLNTYGRFAVPAFSPVLLNLAMIAGALLLAPRLDPPIAGLAWGVLIGGVAQVLWQLPASARLGLLPLPRPRLRDPGVRRILALMLPGALGASAAQINLLVDTVLASFLVAGSVSWLYFADRLLEFPLGVFAIAFATVTLPRLSAQHARGDAAAFSATLEWALRWVVLIGVPAGVGLAVLAGPALATLFGYGAFGAHEVARARECVWAYAPGLAGLMAVKVLAPGFYARQDMRAPVRAAIASLVFNTALGIILIGPLRHAGLALATSLAGYLNAVLLLHGLRTCGAFQPRPGWAGFAGRVAFASAAMAAVLLAGLAATGDWMSVGALERATRLLLATAVGAGVYGGVLLALRLRPGELLRPVQ